MQLIGNGSGSSYIDGEGSGDVITVVGQDVTIMGFTITGCGNGQWDAGIRVEEDRARILENEFVQNRNHGLLLWQSDYHLVEDNTATDNYGGLWTRSTDYSVFRNNRCENNSGTGIDLAGSHNEVINNICSNNGGGIWVRDRSRLVACFC